MSKNGGPVPGPGTEDFKLDRPLGLVAGVAIVVGGVIGMGIFALIAGLGAEAGPSIWLAFTIALLISLIGVAPLIHITSAMPRAGGGYLFTSRLLNPALGTLASSWGILGGACSTTFVSIGLAGYIAQYLPFNIPIRLLAIALVLVFYLLYRFGLKLAASLQILFVAQLFLALMIYAVAGASRVGLSFSLEMPQGIGGFAFSVILAYSACMGFQVIAEMGEEMVNARRNIPLSLVIGGVIILVLYILIGVTFINAVPYDYESIKAMTAPLSETGAKFLSPFFVFFLSIAALSAGLTSFNAAATAIPREFFSQARDGIVPVVLGKIDQRTRSPLNAVGAYFLFVIFLLLVGGFFDWGIDFYGVLTAVGILLFTILICISSLKLPVKFPDRYKKAYFKLSRPLLWILTILAVITSLGFILIVVFEEEPVVGLIYLGWTVLVYIYYRFRVRLLKKRGVDWEAVISRLPGYDEEEEEQ
jgi:basic amino acid/polyamine antiporter, APA family